MLGIVKGLVLALLAFQAARGVGPPCLNNAKNVIMIIGMAAVPGFEWDENKNRTNQRKHGVSFEEAAQVFFDPLHVSIQDRMEAGERRWQTYGFTAGIVLLLVAHTTTEYEEGGQTIEVVRIISARRADRKERRRYEEENG